MAIDDKATRGQLIRLLVELESLITDETEEGGWKLKVAPIRTELAVSVRLVLRAEKGGAE